MTIFFWKRSRQRLLELRPWQNKLGHFEDTVCMETRTNLLKRVASFASAVIYTPKTFMKSEK